MAVASRPRLLLKSCLNGARTRAEHPAVPRTPDELARDGRAAVDAGARVLHLHPYDAGAEALEAEPCAAALRAVRAACPGVPISLSTSAATESDPDRRLELIAGWTELPNLVTANQGEAGIVDLCEHLIARGVGIAAGLLELSDARAQVHHGDGVATWSVMERAVSRGRGIRAGLEDTTVLPDGSPPEGNAELVRTAAAMLAG